MFYRPIFLKAGWIFILSTCVFLAHSRLKDVTAKHAVFESKREKKVSTKAVASIFYTTSQAKPSSTNQNNICEKAIRENAVADSDCNALGNAPKKIPIVVRAPCVRENRNEIFKVIFSIINKEGLVCVFKSDESRQCEVGSGISSHKMAKKLEQLGYEVRSHCRGSLLRFRSPSVCGGPTGQVNVFYIPASKKEKALKNGFRSCREMALEITEKRS